MQTTISLSLSPELQQQLFQRYQQYAIKPDAYMKYSFRLPDCVINVYQSGKTVFQGKGAQEVAKPFTSATDEPPSADLYPQCGSDEVGTGDYFGPVVVSAVYVDADQANQLRSIGVGDSKKITDQIIEQRVPEILPHVIYSTLVLPPERYNQVVKENNMNRIKARMHNQCYVHLQKKCGHLPALRVIDQFCSSDLYYRYISTEPCVIRDITFHTKAEDLYIAVGAASMISRYVFLEEMRKMSSAYHTEFPRGAGRGVDQFARAFIQKYGADALRQTAKLNFTNTRRILSD